MHQSGQIQIVPDWVNDLCRLHTITEAYSAEYRLEYLATDLCVGGASTSSRYILGSGHQ